MQSIVWDVEKHRQVDAPRSGVFGQISFETLAHMLAKPGEKVTTIECTSDGWIKFQVVGGGKP